MTEIRLNKRNHTIKIVDEKPSIRVSYKKTHTIKVAADKKQTIKIFNKKNNTIRVSGKRDHIIKIVNRRENIRLQHTGKTGPTGDIGVTGPTGTSYLTRTGTNLTTTTVGDSMVASDHGTASTAQIVNVCYGIGSPPLASTTPEGTIYVTYIN